MNEGSLSSTSNVVSGRGKLGVSASAFPRTRPSYPSLTIHVSHPLFFLHQNQAVVVKGEETDLRMPALTTARTTAFMPALSPPEVRAASFIFA